MEDLGACGGEVAPKPGGAVFRPSPGWRPEQVPGPGESGSGRSQPRPSWPTLWRGPEADTAGSLGLCLPITWARGCMGDQSDPTRVQPLVSLG